MTPLEKLKAEMKSDPNEPWLYISVPPSQGLGSTPWGGLLLWQLHPEILALWEACNELNASEHWDLSYRVHQVGDCVERLNAKAGEIMGREAEP